VQITVTEQSRYELEVISGHDLPVIAALRRQILGDGVAPLPHEAARAEWLYSKNPAGPAEILALRKHGGPWVGMVAIVPRQIWIDGTEHAGAYLCDFYVHPKHRSLLPALTLQKAAKKRLEDQKLLNYAIPNEKSLPILKRLGADQTFPRYRWARPIRTRPYLARRSGRLGTLVSPLTDLALLLFDAAASVRLTNVRARWVEQVDDRFDQLWSEIRKAGLHIGDRSSRYLQWRFREEPGRTYQLLSLIDTSSERLIGYTVGEAVGREFAIRDLAVSSIDERIRGILSRMLYEMRKLDIDGVGLRIAAPADVLEALRGSGFRSRDPETVLVRGQCFAPKGSWLLTGADEDV
jgi:hypothetical protein